MKLLTQAWLSPLDALQKITLPWSFRGRAWVAQCRAGELAVEADGLVLPAVAAIAAISATVTIATASAVSTATTTIAAISTATTIATATAVAPTAAATTTTTTTATTFTGSGFVDTNHAPHPFDVLKVVNSLLFGRIVG